ncbi:MAG: glycosyl transferase, partial [Dehalococcoidia bacterium]|nr:glycosyl transferase [Dehalococcoidia bacterium]
MIANLRDRLGENATLSKAAVPVSLALLVLATRWPFRTQYLFNWDAANFAFALQDFDVTSHAPHPPGYPYFVGLAKLFDLFLNDANASMVMESLLMSALGVAALFLLGKIMYSPQVGLIAALLLASSVTFWTYGEVALAYTALAPFSTLAALYTYKTIILGQNRLIPLVLCYAIAGGFRPSLLLFLRLVAGICIGGFLLWFLPTAYLSGGLASYGAAFSAYLSQDVLEKYSPIHNGLGALLVNFRDTAAYLFYSLYFSSLFLAGSMFLWLRRPRETFGRREIFILLWVSPMLLFYLFVHIGDPGYVFSVLPGILLL